jgi:hypothetical protein
MNIICSMLSQSVRMILLFVFFSNCSEGEFIPLPTTGDTKATADDVLFVDGDIVQFTDNPYHCCPSVNWRPGDNATWEVRFHGVRPGGTTLAVPFTDCLVYISGTIPPTETTTYKLKPDYTSLGPGEGSIWYIWGIATNDPGAATPWFYYQSLNGEVEMIVSSGKLVVNFADVDVQTADGLYKHKLSGTFTCK